MEKERKKELIFQIKSALISLEREELLNNKSLIKIWEELKKIE